MTILSDRDLTEIAHTLILVGVVAAYWKSRQTEGLLKIQKDTIETLKQGFEACKQRLNDLEETIKNDKLKS